MKHVIAAVMLLIVMAGCAPAGNLAITQPQPLVAVDNKSTQVLPIAVQANDNKSTQVVAAATNQITPLQGIPVTLRYDYLNSEENLYTQVAVSHSSPTFFCPPLGKGIAGNFIESPLIILPNKNGSVCLIKNDSGVYKYLPIGNSLGTSPCTASYPDIVDEKVELSKPGWGLATTFHPENTPFLIKSIKIAGVANSTTGILDDYDKKHIVINVLNNKSEVIWSKYCSWRELRNTQTTSAVWRDIAVDNVTVDGAFTVDVLAASNKYEEIGGAFEYFGIAYEQLNKSGDVTTNSFISGNGKRQNTYITLYDQYGDPVCFNLCIRVGGIY